MKSIVYFGHGIAGYFGIQKLMQSKIQKNISIDAVVVSHKEKEKADLVANIAKDYNIPIIASPFNQVLPVLHEINPTLGVCVHFNQKIPESIINACKEAIWNVHPSDLPKYRGGAPLESIIVNGDPLRITVHEMTGEFDTGDIIYQSNPISIWEMSREELGLFSAKQSAIALDEALQQYSAGIISKTSQRGTPSYANAKDFDTLLRIQWQDDGIKIYRKILAGGKELGGIASLNIEHKEYLFRITQANYISNPTLHTPGMVFAQEDGSYGVVVKGGMIYCSGIKPFDQNPQEIITLLNGAHGQLIMS